eukprot:Selendium_serpulae@DN3100_c0_g1_i3.p1
MRRQILAFATLLGVAAAQKKPEAFLKDFGLKADALEYFNRVAFDVADAFGEDLYGKFDPTYPPTAYPTAAPTYAPPTYAPTVSPYGPPPLPYFPCDPYSQPQEILYVDFDPSVAYSAEDNCKKLTKKILKPFQKQPVGYGEKNPVCKYSKASGGSVDGKANKGVAHQPYSPLGVTVISRGGCSNIYFGQVPGTKLEAPEIDDYGNCAEPGYSTHRRRMDPADHHHGGSSYPVKVYKKGYDYFMQCACLCEDEYSDGYGHGHGHGHGHGGHQPVHQPSYGHQEPSYGHHEPSYGHQPTYKPTYAPTYKPTYAPAPTYKPTYAPVHQPSYGHGHQPAHQPSYGHPEPSYGHSEPSYGHSEPSYGHS